MIPFNLTAAAAILGLALGGIGAGLWVKRGCDAEIATLEATHAKDRADGEAQARAVLEGAVRREREERQRLADEAAGVIADAEARAAALAGRLQKTQAALAAALKEDRACAAWASQPLACPHSW